MVLEKLRRMRFQCVTASIASALLLVALLFGSLIAAQAVGVARGQFVSYSAQPTGATITVQSASQLRVYGVAPSAAVVEVESSASPKPIAYTDLMVGEPLALQLDSGGLVHRIEADYTTVLTRLVTLDRGYAITSNGHAYKLVGQAASFAGPLSLGTFLKLRVDPQTGSAFDMAASKEPFSGGTLVAPVAVTFVVTVPTNTPPTDTVYICADVNNWIPNGIRMSPLSANRWTVTLTLGKGASFNYKYTRGSWQSAESNQAGVVVPNRSMVVTGVDGKQTIDDSVMRWADLPS